MKALSIWQPWASCITSEIKEIETRSWPTKYRGPLLIHAAKHKVSELDWPPSVRFCFSLPLTYGAIIGIAELADCRETYELVFGISDQEFQLGDYSDGRYGWQLRNVREFEVPIPYRGRQGLFEVPDEVVAEHIRWAA